MLLGLKDHPALADTYSEDGAPRPYPAFQATDWFKRLAGVIYRCDLESQFENLKPASARHEKT